MHEQTFLNTVNYYLIMTVLITHIRNKFNPHQA